MPIEVSVRIEPDFEPRVETRMYPEARKRERHPDDLPPKYEKAAAWKPRPSFSPPTYRRACY